MSATEPDFGHLKKLWTLKSVVDSGNFKRAAVRSRVSVSAVSQSITGLEKTLGRKLFIKKDRRLIPTQYCLQVLTSAEPAFQVFENLEKVEMRSLCVPNISWLDFGTSQCVASEILPSLVKHLKAKLPLLRLTLKVGRCQALISMVKKGDLCMALVAGNDALKGLSSYPIYEDRLGVFASAQGNLTAPDALEKGLACLSADSDGHPYYYTQFMRSVESKLKPTLVCDTYETLYEIAASGSMAAILPERLAMKHAGVLRELAIERKSPKARDLPGRFTVSLISQATCDPSEDEFLLSALRSLV